MDISRAGAARAAAAATGQRLGAVDRAAASLLRAGMLTRASDDDGKKTTDEDAADISQGPDAASDDKKSDDTTTTVGAKSEDEAKEDAADEREDDSEQKANDSKKLPNAIDRDDGDVPPLKDKESLESGDLSSTPWDDKIDQEKREIAPPIDPEEDDTPVKHAKTGPAAEDTIDDMMSREFSYSFSTDSDEKIPEPVAQSADHNYLDTVSNVSFDSAEDEQRGWLDGSQNEPGPLSSGDATPIEDLEKNRSIDDKDDDTPSTPSGVMAGVPAS